LKTRVHERIFLTFKRSKDDTPDVKQIPVISDIERIKKVIEIIEFVGDKVGDILDNLPTPQSLTELTSTDGRTSLGEIDSPEKSSSVTTVSTDSAE
jgi:hypothetical protein